MEEIGVDKDILRFLVEVLRSNISPEMKEAVIKELMLPKVVIRGRCCENGFFDEDHKCMKEPTMGIDEDTP